MRYAIIGTDSTAIEAYLPGNYRPVRYANNQCLIEGEDSLGWTLEDYVLPRLATGLYFGKECSELEAEAFKLSLDLSGVGHDCTEQNGYRS